MSGEDFIKILNESEKYSDYQYVTGLNTSTKFKNKDSYRDGLHITKRKYHTFFLKDASHFREVLEYKNLVQLNDHIWKAQEIVLGEKKDLSLLKE